MEGLIIDDNGRGDTDVDVIKDEIEIFFGDKANSTYGLGNCLDLG